MAQCCGGKPVTPCGRGTRAYCVTEKYGRLTLAPFQICWPGNNALPGQYRLLPFENCSGPPPPPGVCTKICPPGYRGAGCAYNACVYRQPDRNGIPIGACDQTCTGSPPPGSGGGGGGGGSGGTGPPPPGGGATGRCGYGFNPCSFGLSSRGCVTNSDCPPQPGDNGVRICCSGFFD